MSTVVDLLSPMELCIAQEGVLKQIAAGTRSDMHSTLDLVWKFRLSRDKKNIDLCVADRSGTCYDELVIRRKVDGTEWTPMKKPKSGTYVALSVDEWIDLAHKMFEYLLS